jgi:RNA polymerase sigma-70 factor (ECF subfamily)
MALVMLRDRGRAEEVTQDVFLKLWKALPSYDGRALPSTWLYSIARNTCLSALRSESYRRTVGLEDVAAPRAAAPVSDPFVGTLLERLPQEQRQAITLFYWEDKSVKDVAVILDLPEGTVKSLLHRARRALGEMMESSRCPR